MKELIGREGFAIGKYEVLPGTTPNKMPTMEKIALVKTDEFPREVGKMAVTGAIYFTGAFAVLLFGLYWKRASRVGAYLALASGSTALLGLKPIQTLLKIDWSSQRVGLTATIIALVAMLRSSFGTSGAISCSERGGPAQMLARTSCAVTLRSLRA